MINDVQLIFDFDDTLVKTNVEFRKTNLEAAQIIARAVYGEVKNIKEIEDYQREIDVKLVITLGFIPERFENSWITTYEHFAQLEDKVTELFVVEVIKQTINDLYIRKYENVPDSIPVLSQLKTQGYSSVILTAGHDEIQRRKIVESGASTFIEKVYVYPKKTPETLKVIMDLHPARTYVMIGNSLKSDIYPALSNDIWGFHVDGETWEADKCEIDQSHKKYVRLTSLSQIPEALQTHLFINQP